MTERRRALFHRYGSLRDEVGGWADSRLRPFGLSAVPHAECEPSTGVAALGLAAAATAAAIWAFEAVVVDRAREWSEATQWYHHR